MSKNSVKIRKLFLITYTVCLQKHRMHSSHVTTNHVITLP